MGGSTTYPGKPYGMSDAGYPAGMGVFAPRAMGKIVLGIGIGWVGVGWGVGGSTRVGGLGMGVSEKLVQGRRRGCHRSQLF